MAYVDELLEEAKWREEAAEEAGGEWEFWTNERLELKGRMEGRWRGEGAWGS